jgi:hypothetical protein
VFLPASCRVSIAVPNPVPRADSFFYSYAVLAELEERDVESILRYMPSSVNEF